MRMFVRGCLAGVIASFVTTAAALQLAYEPVALGWSPDEVDQATRRTAAALADPDTGPMHHATCSATCLRIRAIYERLLPVARSQTAHAARLDWQLRIVHRTDVEALALPGGVLFVGEAFVARAVRHDAELAFLLAHEMAHAVLEHERQALSFARLLLPNPVDRSVGDMYAEIDHNFRLLKDMEPVMQQGELEADELGLLMASAAGYAPNEQLGFMTREASAPEGRRPLVATHPPAAERLRRLRSLLPWAERLWPEP